MTEKYYTTRVITPSVKDAEINLSNRVSLSSYGCCDSLRMSSKNNNFYYFIIPSEGVSYGAGRIKKVKYAHPSMSKADILWLVDFYKREFKFNVSVVETTDLKLEYYGVGKVNISDGVLLYIDARNYKKGYDTTATACLMMYMIRSFVRNDVKYFKAFKYIKENTNYTTLSALLFIEMLGMEQRSPSNSYGFFPVSALKRKEPKSFTKAMKLGTNSKTYVNKTLSSREYNTNEFNFNDRLDYLKSESMYSTLAKLLSVYSPIDIIKLMPRRDYNNLFGVRNYQSTPKSRQDFIDYYLNVINNLLKQKNKK